jgi:hypothetical protein
MVPGKLCGSVVVAGACAWFAAGAVALAADDQTQARICKRLLDAMADGKPEQATDIMLLEGQPSGIQITKEGESNLDTMRMTMRRTYEGVLRNNGGNPPQAREPLPERHFGDRIAVVERWDFGTGRKFYAGCVRYPEKTAWITNVQFSPEESFVVSKLQDAAAGKPYPPPAPTK